MRRLLTFTAVLLLSAGPALAGPSVNGLPTPSVLGLAVAGVVAAVFLARHKR